MIKGVENIGHDNGFDKLAKTLKKVDVEMSIAIETWENYWQPCVKGENVSLKVSFPPKKVVVDREACV